jgi:hypothetical protein
MPGGYAVSTRRWKPDSPAKVILGVLLYEFGQDDHTKSEEAIKRRLRYYKLGKYDQGQVDVLRRLKDSLQDEIGRYDRSQYFLGHQGKYSSLQDFDVKRMVAEYSEAFPEVGLSELAWFVPFALYAYYLR